MLCSFLLTGLDPSDERKVIVKKLALCVPDRPDMELDLSGDLSQLKKQVQQFSSGTKSHLFLYTISSKWLIAISRSSPSKKVSPTGFELILLFSERLFMDSSMCRRHIAWVFQVRTT